MSEGRAPELWQAHPFRENAGWDLVVVGGGPAGVMAAGTAARAGLRVALLDYKPRERIGDKVCGDALITKFLHCSLPPAVARVTLPRDGEIEDVIEWAELVVPSGKSIRLHLPRHPLVTVDRHVYGQRLLADADAAGVRIYAQHAVHEPIVERDRVVGVVAHDRERDVRIAVRAPLVVDASGSTGAVRRALPVGFAPHLTRALARPGEVVVTFRQIARTKAPHEFKGRILLCFRPELPPPGYLWYFSRGEQLLNVGIGYRDATMPAKARPHDLFRKAVQADGRLGDHAVLDSRGGTIPARRPLDTSVAPGLLVAGDAGFHADSLSGEGHGTALLAGYWAGVTAVAAHRRGDFSEVGLWPYNQQCMAHFGRVFAARAFLARALESFATADFDFVHGLVDEKRASNLYQANEFSELGVLTNFPALLDILWRVWLHRHQPSPGFARRFVRANWQAHRIRQHCSRYPADPSGLRKWIERMDCLFAANC